MKSFLKSPPGQPLDGQSNELPQVAKGWNTVGNKLALGVGLLLGLFVVSVLISLTQTQIVKGSLKDVVEVAEPSSAAAQTMEISLERTAIEVFAFFNDHDEHRLSRIDDHRRSFEAARTQYLSLEVNAERTKLIEDMDRDYSRFDVLSDDLLAMEIARSAKMAELRTTQSELSDLTSSNFHEMPGPFAGPTNSLQAKKFQIADMMESSTNRIRGLSNELLETGESPYKVQLEVERSKLRTYIADYRDLTLRPSELVWIPRIDALQDETVAITDESWSLFHLQNAKKTELFGVLTRLGATLNQEIQVLSRQRLNDNTTSVQNTLDRANQVILLLLLVGLVAGAVGGIMVTRRITKPIHDLVLANRMLAAGDLSQRVEIDSKDEFGALSQSFNQMAAERQRAVNELQNEIYEHQRAEEALEKKTSELERSNSELEQFAYVASHDLQEPLRSIVGFSGLLIRRYRDQLDEDADRLMNRIVNATSRMQGLISDLLTYSRVGKAVRELGPVDCDKLIGEEIGNLQAAIDEKGATVTHDSLPQVRADNGLLGQVFRNLVGNAIKFSSADTPSVHISSELGEDE